MGDGGRRSCVAGREIPCPDPAGHALVLALHSLRDPHDEAKAHELAMLESHVTEIADDDWLLDLARLAARPRRRGHRRALPRPRGRSRRGAWHHRPRRPARLGPAHPARRRHRGLLGARAAPAALVPPPRLPLVRRVATTSSSGWPSPTCRRGDRRSSGPADADSVEGYGRCLALRGPSGSSRPKRFRKPPWRVAR